MSTFKAGFVNIIGRPNTGKSTLMNALMGQKFSIINKKAQTTRHRIIGILSSEDYQVVFSDTPGIIKPSYKLQESMMRFVKDTFQDADILIVLVDPKQKLEDIQSFYKQFIHSNAKKYFLINKIDLINEKQIQQVTDYWKEQLDVDYFDCISAKDQIGTADLFTQVIRDLPEHPPYYPEDALTDKPERFFISEIIREKILNYYKEEIPYSVEVIIDSFKEEENIIRIGSTIITNRKSHKPILIGKGGSMLKKVGTAARKDAELFFGKKIYLELYVKVKEGWRNNELMLRHLGYH